LAGFDFINFDFCHKQGNYKPRKEINNWRRVKENRRQKSPAKPRSFLVASRRQARAKGRGRNPSFPSEQKNEVGKSLNPLLPP
jgi:hypothetical protein